MGMREEFEAWARDSGEWDNEEDPLDWMCYVKPDGTYYASSLELAWQSWQASRAALVIELPRALDSDRGWIIDKDETVEALTDAGVSYK